MPGRSLRAVGCVGERDQHTVAPPDRELARLRFELARERFAAGEQAHFEQRRERVDVGVGERDRFLHRTRRMPGDEAGVPQRVPELLGHGPHGVGRTPFRQRVHEHHVDIRAGTHLATSVRPERDQRDVTRVAELRERGEQCVVERVGHRLAERASS